MKKDLVKRATIGDPATPWETLLAAGTEALREIGTKLPKPKANPDSILFCEPDEGDALTEEQADFLLDNHLLATGIPTGKRFPYSRLERLLNYMVEWISCCFISRNEARAICGNAGLFLALASNNDAWKLGLFYGELMWDSLAPDVFLRETSRAADDDRNLDVRLGAIGALRKRDPNKAREKIESLWTAGAKSKLKLTELRTKALATLRVGLCDEDVPFLERAVQTEDVDIFRDAIRLLARLPTSRVGRELRALGDATLTRDGRFVPPLYSQEMARLGIPKRDGVLLGVEVLGAIPTDYWEERFGATPEKIAESIPFLPETEPIYSGWVLAFAKFGAFGGSESWARALEPIGLALEFEELEDKVLEKFMKELADGYSSRADLFHLYALNLAPKAELEFKLKKTERTIKNPRKRELEMFSLRVTYEPKPWSDEFCDEYYRIALESGPVPHEFESTFAGNIRNFSRPVREKILAELKKNPDASKRRKSSISIAEYQASRADDVERIIGDYRLVD
ncbi:MAG: hypothetical protein IJM30_10440 [Thermoguttaceae bacterium]|nr:hypothetical protein [Thermoguttaceae bacterium]